MCLPTAYSIQAHMKYKYAQYGIDVSLTLHPVQYLLTHHCWTLMSLTTPGSQALVYIHTPHNIIPVLSWHPSVKIKIFLYLLTVSCLDPKASWRQSIFFFFNNSGLHSLSHTDLWIVVLLKCSLTENFFQRKKKPTKQPTHETTSFTYHFCFLAHQENLTCSYSQLNVLALHVFLTRPSLTADQTSFGLWNLFIFVRYSFDNNTSLMILKSPRIAEALIISDILF